MIHMTVTGGWQCGAVRHRTTALVGARDMDALRTLPGLRSTQAARRGEAPAIAARTRQHPDHHTDTWPLQ